MFDLVVIGGGPAGLSAGIYGARLGLNVLVLEREKLGGKVLDAPFIENFPGFYGKGSELASRFMSHAVNSGVLIKRGEVLGVELDGDIKMVFTSMGDFSSRSVIIASGAGYKLLGVPGEGELIGNGIFFCAVCDGPYFEGKRACVVGAGDTGITNALYLLNFAREVIVIEALEKPTASRSLLERALSDERISFLFSKRIEGFERDGEDVVVCVGDGRVKVGGVILSAGLSPNTGYLPSDILEDGWVLTDGLMRTKFPGVFACGDVRKNSPRQIITAVSDGAVASIMAHKYLRGDDG